MAVLHTKRTKTSGTGQGFYFARAVLLSVILVLFFSCASTRRAPYTYFAEEESVYIPAQFDWKPVFDGADYFCYENKSFPMRYHCVRIDLTTPNLQILSFPAEDSDYKKEDGKRSKFFIGKRTGSFARKSGADIAINSSPFAGKNGKWDLYAHVTRTRQIVGVHILDKKEFSPPLKQFCALLFKKDGDGWKATIIDSQTPETVADSDYAFGGFWTILRDEQKIPFKVETHDSRTGAGLSKDGTMLYLLIVEGEKVSMSEGLSYPECADVFLAMGADDAMQFDGGGSSSLFISGKNMLSYPSIRVNAASIGFSFTKTAAQE